MRNYKNEVKGIGSVLSQWCFCYLWLNLDFLAADSQMASEIQYDLKRFEEQQKTPVATSQGQGSPVSRQLPLLTLAAESSQNKERRSSMAAPPPKWVTSFWFLVINPSISFKGIQIFPRLQFWTQLAKQWSPEPRVRERHFLPLHGIGGGLRWIRANTSDGLTVEMMLCLKRQLKRLVSHVVIYDMIKSIRSRALALRWQRHSNLHAPSALPLVGKPQTEVQFKCRCVFFLQLMSQWATSLSCREISVW